MLIAQTPPLYFCNKWWMVNIGSITQSCYCICHSKLTRYFDILDGTEQIRGLLYTNDGPDRLQIDYVKIHCNEYLVSIYAYREERITPWLYFLLLEQFGKYKQNPLYASIVADGRTCKCLWET